MTFTTRSRAAWQSLRQLPRRTPLRVKLITATLALVAIGLVIISVTGLFAFRDYLTSRADAQVRQQFTLAVLAYQQNTLRPTTIETAGGGAYITAFRLEGRQLPQQYGSRQHPLTLALPDVPVGKDWVRAHENKLVTVGGLNSHDRWEVMVAPAPYSDFFNSSITRSGTLIVGVDLGDIDGSIARLAAIDAIVGAVLLIGLAVIGFAVVRASLRPLTEIERTAGQIAAGDLTRRVPEADPRTEVGSLGRSLNTMLEHIEGAFRAQTASEETARRSEEAARRSALAASRSEDRMRRFVADASHELRTPLTAIRGYAEYYRQRGGTAATNGEATSAANGEASADELTRPDLNHLIQRVEQEAKRMGVLVDDLLLLARLDQQRPLDFRTVDLLAIAADALHDARVIAPERAITLTVGSPDAALVIGDEAGLRQVVGNLTNNAMTHTPKGTPIDITILVAKLPSGRAPGDVTEPAVVLQVTDQGPGLSETQKEHVFERFYRTDRARSRTGGGTGLGLAIVSAMVAAHHGTVWVDSEPGHGATFGFALPLAPEARLTSA
jgi:two-component system OmpR family sensor kinase